MGKNVEGGMRSSQIPATVKEVVAVLSELGLPHEPDSRIGVWGYSVFIPMAWLQSKQQLEAFSVAIRRLELMAHQTGESD